MLEEYSLDGKVALVTGAASAIGRAVALGLAEAGAAVACAAADEEGAQETSRQIASQGGRSTSMRVDVRDAASVEAMVERTRSELGGLDILFNGEEVDFGKPLLDVTEAEVDAVLDINVKGMIRCARAAGKHMLDQGKGKIINLASGMSARAAIDATVYAASKGAVAQFTQALALEWGPGQVSVNAVAPGWFATEEVDPEEEMRDPLVRMIPVRHRGRPEDLVGLVVYLASDAGDYVTAQTIYVDGGALCHG